MSIFVRSLLVFGALAVGAGVDAARAQATFTETVLRNFSAPTDPGYQFGYRPQMGVLLSGGDLYGSASAGGKLNGGAIYRRAGNGQMTVLYSFTDTKPTNAATWCGFNPSARLVRDSAGDLYGTTYQGGENDGGVVFRLHDDGSGEWTCTVLNAFFKKPGSGDPKGYGPFGGLTLVGQDTLYGTAQFSGATRQNGVLIPSGGIIFKLTRNGASWDYDGAIYTFRIGTPSNGLVPTGPLFFKSGLLYGATSFGGINNGGVVYKIDPAAPAASFTVIFRFNGDTTSNAALRGYQPTQGPLAVDNSDIVYGATSSGGKDINGAFINAGVVFKLTPSGNPMYTYEMLHSFDSQNLPGNGFGPIGGVTLMNNALYGVTQFGGAAGGGSVYKLSGGLKRTFTLLYDFPDASLGFRPSGPLVVSGQETIIGTTLIGGNFNAGTIFRLTPP
ncbi:MAG TPA: choice-of-anchor tandem repeat GloVer-containing protein [Pseudolabrys sp.]|nr:choice-of-anchor tandem repeat GloVer-containing protein [Pseudolabrys sp.]